MPALPHPHLRRVRAPCRKACTVDDENEVNFCGCCHHACRSISIKLEDPLPQNALMPQFPPLGIFKLVLCSPKTAKAAKAEHTAPLHHRPSAYLDTSSSISRLRLVVHRVAQLAQEVGAFLEEEAPHLRGCVGQGLGLCPFELQSKPDIKMVYSEPGRELRRPIYGRDCPLLTRGLRRFLGPAPSP